MHRTLKAATASPAAGNLRQQQQRFDEFREEYNEQRPHEALGMKVPDQVYRPSARAYPSRLAEPEYGGGLEIRRVMECGRIRWWSDNIFVGKALAGQMVGLEPVDDGLWKVWFFQYPIGQLDERHGKLERLAATTGSATAAEGNAPDGAHEALPHTPPGGEPPETPSHLSL
jgi:hypothetical protein